jgi:hypothetical protein
MLGFILNFPYTVMGLFFALLSMPQKLAFRKNPYAFIFQIRRFWWAAGYIKNARAMAIGHVVMLGSAAQSGDLEHELVHVVQCERAPVIWPLLYFIELLRKGYADNKYEKEAYQKAGNLYNEL